MKRTRAGAAKRAQVQTDAAELTEEQRARHRALADFLDDLQRQDDALYAMHLELADRMQSASREFFDWLAGSIGIDRNCGLHIAIAEDGRTYTLREGDRAANDATAGDTRPAPPLH